MINNLGVDEYAKTPMATLGSLVKKHGDNKCLLYLDNKIFSGEISIDRAKAIHKLIIELSDRFAYLASCEDEKFFFLTVNLLKTYFIQKAILTTEDPYLSRLQNYITAIYKYTKECYKKKWSDYMSACIQNLPSPKLPFNGIYRYQ